MFLWRKGGWLLLLLGLSACAQQPLVPVVNPALERIRHHLTAGDIAYRSGHLEAALVHFALAEQTLADAGGADTGLRGDEALWRIALVHEAEERWLEAAETWSLAARRVDRAGETLQRLGWARLRARQYGLAREAFDAALQHAGGSAQNHLGLALVSESLRELTVAEAHLIAALDLEPEHRPAQLARARVALRLGDLATARFQLRMVLADGETPAAWAVLGDVFAHEGDYAAALQAYTRNLPLHAAWARLGHQAMRREDYAAAVHYFDQAAKESPQYIDELHKQRAIAHELHRDRSRSAP